MLACCFFGHADAPQTIRETLKRKLVYLIEHKSADTFFVGNQGNYDKIVAEVLREVQKIYPYIKYSIVLAYREQRTLTNEDLQKHCIYPKGIEAVPKKAAIPWRNKWMIQNSKIVVSYIVRTNSRASKFVEFAIRQGKEIINLE